MKRYENWGNFRWTWRGTICGCWVSNFGKRFFTFYTSYQFDNLRVKHDIKINLNYIRIYILCVYLIYMHYETYIYFTLSSNKMHYSIYTFLSTLEAKMVSWNHPRGIAKVLTVMRNAFSNLHWTTLSLRPNSSTESGILSFSSAPDIYFIRGNHP